MKLSGRILKHWLAGLWLLSVVQLQAALWVTGYYPAYQRATLSPDRIDFGTVTHLIHFALQVNPNASVDPAKLGLDSSHMSNAVARAHAAGRKVLICAGGAGSEPGFQGATSGARLATLISNLTLVVAQYDYDGVDLDWEPMSVADHAPFTNLVRRLRSALDEFPSKKLLTAAVGAFPGYGEPPKAQYQMLAGVQGQLDQINVMTYDLAGPYPGWVTWFNAPVFDGGSIFPSTGTLLPSLDGAVRNFLSNGVAASKLGIGIPFYGYLWSGGGVAQPRQSWPEANVPVFTAESYATIATTYLRSNVSHWDTNAHSAYLSISNGASGLTGFLSYDDARSVQTKVSYARSRGLGGVMIWELSQEYFPSAPAAGRHPLSQAINEALLAPGRMTAELFNAGATLQFTGMPLGSYRVQWSGDLASPVWNTLVATNFVGPSGLVSVTDPHALNGGQRFYRVQSDW